MQDEVESVVLQRLRHQLMELDAGLAEGDFVVVETDPDQGHPKTRTDQKNWSWRGNIVFASSRARPRR